MKRRFLLFGSTESPLVVGDRIAGSLGVRLRIHESSYRGGEYLRGEGQMIEEVIVQSNAEDDEGYLVEGDFPQFPTLVYVTQLDDLPRFESLAIDGLEILRVEVL